MEFKGLISVTYNSFPMGQLYIRANRPVRDEDKMADLRFRLTPYQAYCPV